MLLLVAFLTFCFAYTGNALSCRDEKGTEIEWFINYKLPRLKENENKLVANGEAYAYLQSNHQTDRWVLSDTSVVSETSMLGETLDQYYDASDEEEFTYLFYSDQPPDEGSRRGHTKGFVIFDGSTGIWVIHSIPRFPNPKYYEYPKTGHMYGQVALCMTFNTSLLEKIGIQLLYNEALVYSSYLSEDVGRGLSHRVKTLFSERPKYFTKKRSTNAVRLINTAGDLTISFAKSAKFNDDLYSKLIAPDLDTSLLVESWRHNKKKLFGPYRGKKLQVEDVEFIVMTVDSGGTSEQISFSNWLDHSKWAVSKNDDSHWICIGDINRELTQKRRGGGALCFISKRVSSVFRNMIAAADRY